MKLNMTKAIQNLVDETGMTKGALETCCGLSYGSLTKAEGYTDIKFTMLIRIATGLGRDLTNVIDALDVPSIKITSTDEPGVACHADLSN